MSCLNEQQNQHPVSLETEKNSAMNPKTFPLSPKPSEFLYGSKGYLNRASPEYLNKMMSPSFSVRSAFLQDCERRRKAKGVSFDQSSSEKEVDYGYGEMDMNPQVSVRSAFLRDCEKRRKTSKGVSFEPSADSEEIDYGYGVDIAPPPAKRMRMQRRNSKTPQMLMAMSASLATLDFLNETDNSLFSSESKGDAFDGGLQIAEDLVKHLQTRRRRSALKP
mmetsp:Transcript_16553/g.31464  ORF Transcript_16553/g.31464 Transcript_16553/m.31464 type:complete len:220 (-) Transcript_16553:124-783(-)|eukprot:scaffold2501_cov174-Amphora_coffeaeformis.AAC.9